MWNQVKVADATKYLNLRFEENVYKSEGGDDTEGEESDDSSRGRKRGDRKGDRKKRREDEEYRPDELAFNKSEYFKVSSCLYLPEFSVFNPRRFCFI